MEDKMVLIPMTQGELGCIVVLLGHTEGQYLQNMYDFLTELLDDYGTEVAEAMQREILDSQVKGVDINEDRAIDSLYY